MNTRRRRPLALSHGVKDAPTSKAIRQLEGVARDAQTDITNLQTATQTFTGTASGVVPAGGSASTFLRGDSTWHAAPGFLGRIMITATGSGNLDARCGAIVARVVGGGGGGGGALGGTALGAGAGGGSGVCAERALTVSGGAAYSATVGTGGTAGSATGGNGGTGGTSSLTVGSATITAPGGTGGAGCTAQTAIDLAGGGPSAAASGADVSGSERGHRGFILSGATFPGAGADAGEFGTGGVASVGIAGSGSDGAGHGSGGGGANSSSASGYLGGAGAAGIIIIDQFTWSAS